jgi:hypothetical protein
MTDRSRWVDYYAALKDRGPRELFLEALACLKRQARQRTWALVTGPRPFTCSRGWRVLAVDREPEAVKLLGARVPASLRSQLEMRVAGFEDVILPPSDLIYADWSTSPWAMACRTDSHSSSRRAAMVGVTSPVRVDQVQAGNGSIPTI